MTVRSLLCKRSLHVRIFLREGVCVSSVCVRRETGRRGAAPAAGAARALGSASGLSRGVSGARLLRRTLRRRHGHGDVGSSLELLYPDRAFVKIVWREGFLCEGCLRADRRAVCLASGQTDPPHDSPHATRTGPDAARAARRRRGGRRRHVVIHVGGFTRLRLRLSVGPACPRPISDLELSPCLLLSSPP